MIILRTTVTCDVKNMKWMGSTGGRKGVRSSSV